MTTSPENPEKNDAMTVGDENEADAAPTSGSAPAPIPRSAPASKKEPKPVKKKHVHEVKFVTYPKLLFIWPIILAGFVFYPFAAPVHPDSAVVGDYQVALARPAAEPPASAPASADSPDAAASTTKPISPFVSDRLEGIGWAYIWIAIFVLLTLGVDLGRNQFAFWVVVVVAIWVLGLWLQDTKGFTIFGDIYRWFAGLDVQYDRAFGLALSVLLLVPYVIMLGWARINDKWRITHNEFEHYSFGKSDDSLGRGAKTIRTSFPDVLELLLGMAGTLIVFNATGTRELRRIPHVMFLPLVRKRLALILEKTAVTAAQMEEEEDDDEDM